MTFTATIDAEHHLVVPDTVVTDMKLVPGSQFLVEIKEPIYSADPEAKRQRAERLEAALLKYQGSMREQMLAEGYASVDELMNEMRPPW